MEETESQSQEWTNRRDVAIIGDESMTEGFRLAGVHESSTVDASDQGRFDSELARMADLERYSVIIACQRQLTNINPELSKKLNDRVLPIVIGIPDKLGEGGQDDSLRQALKRSLGIQMR